MTRITNYELEKCRLNVSRFANREKAPLRFKPFKIHMKKSKACSLLNNSKTASPSIVVKKIHLVCFPQCLVCFFLCRFVVLSSILLRRLITCRRDFLPILSFSTGYFGLVGPCGGLRSFLSARAFLL